MVTSPPSQTPLALPSSPSTSSPPPRKRERDTECKCPKLHSYLTVDDGAKDGGAKVARALFAAAPSTVDGPMPEDAKEEGNTKEEGSEAMQEVAKEVDANEAN